MSKPSMQRSRRKPFAQQMIILGLISIIALGSFATVLAGSPNSPWAAPQQPVLPAAAPQVRAEEAPELRLKQLGLDQLPAQPAPQRSPEMMQDTRNPPQGTKPLAVPGPLQIPDPARAPRR